MKFRFNEFITARWILKQPRELNKESFRELCSLLKTLPCQQASSPVIGLHLEGYRFFKNIEFDELQLVTEEEIKRITGITPHLKKGGLPWGYNSGLLEVRILTRTCSVTDLMQKLKTLERYLSGVKDEACIPELEAHLIKGANRTEYKKILQDVIPGLTEGHYNFCFHIASGQAQTGELDLPGDFNDFPAALKELTNAVVENDYIRIYKEYKAFILERIKKMLLGASIYSNEIAWLEALLQQLENKELLETPVPAGYCSVIPKLIRNVN